MDSCSYAKGLRKKKSSTTKALKSMKRYFSILLALIFLILSAPAHGQRTGGSFGGSRWGSGSSSRISSSPTRTSWSRPTSTSYRSPWTRSSTARTSTGVILVHTGTGGGSSNHYHYHSDGVNDNNGDSLDGDAVLILFGIILAVVFSVVLYNYFTSSSRRYRRW